LKSSPRKDREGIENLLKQENGKIEAAHPVFFNTRLPVSGIVLKQNL
jgi:hypothetical protein